LAVAAAYGQVTGQVVTELEMGKWPPARSRVKALFRLGVKKFHRTVALSFVFDNYCPIMT
jgi:hypothetical protein